MTHRTVFPTPWLAYLILLPQLLITLVFFFWPAWQALVSAFYIGDPFGVTQHFVGWANFIDIFSAADYWQSMRITLMFSVVVAVFTMGLGLLMAVLVCRVNTGAKVYQTLFIWPYAVAPAVAGILWRFLFNPIVGVVPFYLQQAGYDWNYLIHARQAFWLCVIASVWQQFSYNFLFYLAALKSIPQSILEAATIDGAGSIKRFWTIVFPLLSPISFFLLVMNLIYAFFDTFGVISVVTQGGPAGATNTLIYKVYKDGFLGLDFGSSAAQSVVLMAIVCALTLLQFRMLEKKVHY